MPRIRNFLAVLGAESHPSMAATVENARSAERGLTVLATLDSVDLHADDLDAVFLEYAWDMAWCDPCAADPLSTRELRELGLARR